MQVLKRNQAEFCCGGEKAIRWRARPGSVSGRDRRVMSGLHAECSQCKAQQGKGTRGAMTVSSGITRDGEGESSLVSFN